MNIDNTIVIDSSLKEKHLYRASSTNSEIMHQIRPNYCLQFWNKELHDSDEEREFLSWLLISHIGKHRERGIKHWVNSVEKFFCHKHSVQQREVQRNRICSSDS